MLSVVGFNDYFLNLKMDYLLSETMLVRVGDVGFPGGTVVKNLPANANAGDTGSCPGLGRSHMPRSN